MESATEAPRKRNEHSNMGENDETGNGARMSRLYEKRDELRLPKPPPARPEEPAGDIGFLCDHPWKPGHTCPESEAT